MVPEISEPALIYPESVRLNLRSEIAPPPNPGSFPFPEMWRTVNRAAPSPGLGTAMANRVIRLGPDTTLLDAALDRAIADPQSTWEPDHENAY
jgi:hypothetical protein